MNDLPAEKNRRILIIDDNHAIHDDFRKILSSPAGATALDATEEELFGKPANRVQPIRYEIDSAYQGQDGVLLVKRALEAGRPYAMAFVDVRMPPGMDGVETTGKIWELDPDLQIVLCTAYSDYSWGQVFEKLGRHDGLLILKKPFDTVEALQLAQALTEKWWLHRQSRQKLEDLESRVAGRTRQLQESNQALRTEVVEHQRAAASLRESEERFSGAFEHAPIGVALVTPDGHYFKVNRALCELVGYSEAELLTHTFQDITHPEDLEADLENVRQLRAGEIGSYQMEKRYVHAQGHLVTVLLNVSLVRDDQGQPRYFISQVQDITQRKQAEEKLKLFRALIEGSSDAIHVVDPATGRFLDVNESACRALGYTRDEHLALTVFDVVEIDRAYFHSTFARAKKTGHARAEVLHRRKDGTTYPVEVNLSSVTIDREYLLAVVRDITERKGAESALRDSEAFLNTLIEKIPHMIFVKDAKELRFLKFNQAGQDLLGYSLADLAGKNDYDLFPKEMADHFTENDRTVLRGREVVDIPEEPVQTRDKGERILHTKKIPIFDNAGQLTYLLGISEDVTERKRLETQLIQSQKMETVGKLAGGIAHEFNSILTAIIGQSELLLGDLPAGSPLAQNAAEITKAADRAATLTRQLLAYGRKQFLQPQALNLNQVISSMGGVLSHLMGGDMVDVNIVPAAGLKLVKADAGQIEQVIMNLAMNARDAMPNGGKLTLETANVSFDDDSVGRYPELKPGGYVMLAVTDTGRGMSEKVKARAFEPFFTTKDVGQGTGLGLSTCYGIVKQSGGHINVYSEPGRGTTFKIYLPQVESSGKIPVERLDSPDLPRGVETILLVEDDPALREMAATLLRRLGYTVFPAANGVDALSLANERDTGHVDLLFTDVVMPHMSGKELADRVRALYPHTRILFTSAYTENAIVHQGALDKGVALLQKPFTPSALAIKVREALDAPGAPQPDAARETSGLISDEAVSPGS